MCCQIRYICEIGVCIYCAVNLFFQGEEIKSQGVRGFLFAQVRSGISHSQVVTSGQVKRTHTQEKAQNRVESGLPANVPQTRC